MYPVFHGFSRLNFYAHVLFTTLGLLTGILMAVREADRLRIDHHLILDLCFYLLFASMIGSRVFFVATHPDIFIDDPREIYRIWNGGISVWGGCAGALIAAAVFIKIHHLPPGRTADLTTPALAAGLFISRLHYHFAEHVSRPPIDLMNRLDWFNNDPGAAVLDGRLFHPVALYFSLNDLIIFALIWYFKPLKKFDGQIFCLYVFLYGMSRFWADMYRLSSDKSSEPIGILAAGAAAGTFAVIMLAILINRSRK